MEKPTLYFICTGNSARSQMAEGFARKMLGARFHILSGGLSPSSLNPLAVTAMAEVGIDISHQLSQPIDVDKLETAHTAITLCGDAAERCPVTPPEVTRVHWPLPDPAKVQGTEEERLAVFRDVRDQIRQLVAELTAHLS